MLLYRLGRRPRNIKTYQNLQDAHTIRALTEWGGGGLECSIFPILAGGIMVHFVFLAFNGLVTEGLSRVGLMPWKERKAVWMLTSQKTLPVRILSPSMHECILQTHRARG